MLRIYSIFLWGGCLFMSLFTPQFTHAQLAVGDRPGQEALTAKKILYQMGWTYESCKTYRDTGVLRSDSISPDGKQTVTTEPFSTVFVRPDRFRFEYLDKIGQKEERYLIWNEGKKVQRLAQSWDRGPRVEKAESLDDALGGSTGVTGNPVFEVPVLLLSRMFQRRRSLMTLAKMKRLADGVLERADCFRIAGDYLDSPVVIWIDKNTFLIRRIDSSLKGNGFDPVEYTTTYEPSINQKIPDELLKFDLPRK